jgi:hypothetical protein
MSDPTAEDGSPGEGEAPPDPEQVDAATKIQRVVRGHTGRVRQRNEAEERRQERVRVPNSGWGFDQLRSVMLNSVLVAPAPKIATDVDLVPIASNVAETVVSSYEGERNADGEYHGQGIATFASGSKYQGFWAHGLMDGKGTFTWNNKISYSGQMVRGRICGRGTLRWPGGNVYDGEVLDGYRHGKGKFVMVMESDEVEDESAVITYDGMWHMGKRHGHGVLLYDSDGKAKYDGGWANDLRHGEGTMQYASGNFYQGGWARGLMHGHGKMLWHTRNEVYIGEWREGRPDGAGEHVWFAELQSGTPFQTLNRYSGEMAHGLRHGQGRFEYADGSSYEGAWVEGAKHGEGTFVFPDGHRYAGAFAQDRMVDYKKPARVPGASGTQEVVLRIGDLLAQEADAEAHVLKVKNVLVQYMSELKQIFRYYSQAAKEEDAGGKKTPLPLAANPNEQKARPGGANSLIRLSATQRGLIDNSFAMSMLDFWKMARDCRLPDARLSLAAIDRVFLLVDQHSHDRADALAVHSPHRKLIFRAFLEGLVRLADGKYPELPTLAERLTYMLFHNLLPYACQDTADDFRQVPPPRPLLPAHDSPSAPHAPTPGQLTRRAPRLCA